MSENKKNLINHAQIDWSDQSEPISTLFNDIYFNTEQGIEESFYVFFQGNQLTQRWENCQSSLFTIAESGFGTGLNFLITCLHFQLFLKNNPDSPLKNLCFSSFEKYPLNKADLHHALTRWPSLKDFIAPLIEQYPLPLAGCHRISLAQYNITLDLWFGDIQQTLATLYYYPSGLFDCWYLDGFSPNKNPDMWTDALFKQIAQSCKPNATIATFTAAGFVRRGLSAAGFRISKRKGYGVKREMLVGQLEQPTKDPKQYANNLRICGQTKSKDIAIIGGGLASACLSLALVNRGYKVTLYCQNATLAHGASGNQQGALYPLLNQQHDDLSQFFANSFLYARNYVERINQSYPLEFDFSGLLQLYYDQAASKKLDKILQANLPTDLVHKLTSEETDAQAQLAIGQDSLFYPLGGWLNPQQMVKSIFKKAQREGQITINLNSHVQSFTKDPNGWLLKLATHSQKHPLLVLTTAMNTLSFTQAEAVPLSAARGQVTYIDATKTTSKLKVTLCHEGYLTPASNNKHSMGASFKRHQLNTDFSMQEQQGNKDKLQKCIPKQKWIEGINCEHSHANVGIRCTTRDHFPYVGALADYHKTQLQYKDAQKQTISADAPFYEDLFLLTGLGSRGLCTAPLLAELLASQINQEPLPFSQSILNALQTNRQWINYLKKGKRLNI